MAIPQILKINAFDANIGTTVKFTYTGNQINANRLIIKNNDTNKIVYSVTQYSSLFEHIIPIDNNLINGNCYTAEIQVIEQNTNEVYTSKKAIFYCYSTPILKITNIENEQIIHNSFIVPNISYTQAEGELLNEFKVVVYNNTGIQVFTSKTLYNLDAEIYISGLIDNSEYYIECICTTVNGMTTTTGLIKFSVNYDSPYYCNILTCENIALEGKIKLFSYIVSIEGECSNPSPTYEDGWIDLTDDTYVTFNKDFEINDNFTLQFIISSFDINKDVFEFSDGENKGVLKIRNRTQTINIAMNSMFAEIYVENGYGTYITTSNYIDPIETLNVWLRKIDGTYEIIIKGVD